jgi:methyl-accepting chemotaxis protein
LGIIFVFVRKILSFVKIIYFYKQNKFIDNPKNLFQTTMKFRIQTKLLIYILSTSSVIYLLAFGYMSYTDYDASIIEARKLTETYAEKYAKSIEMELNSDMAIARTLVQSFSDYKKFHKGNNQSTYYLMLKQVLESNPQFHNSALNFELSAINEKYNRDYGRVRMIYYKSGGLILNRLDTLETEGDNITGQYYDMKINPREEISEPYMFSPTNSDIDLVMISSISIPIMDEGYFAGLLQFDVNMERFRSMVNEIKPYEGSYGFLISNKGIFAAIQQDSLINQPVEKMGPGQNLEFNILPNLNQGNSFSYELKDKDDTRYYVVHYPLKFGNSRKYWSLGIAVPFDEMIKKARQNLIFSVLVTFAGFILLTFVIYFISRSISLPLIGTAETIRELALGNISSDKKMHVAGKDEIADIRNSLNTLIDNLENNLQFALQIGKGNLDYEFQITSNKDVLGRALMDMRRSLKQAVEEEAKRKEEDEKFNWATKGSAMFGELMREKTDKLSEFSYNIISNLVKYLDGCQGGLFIINDSKKDDIYIELSASYAYDRRKYLEKKIKLGVGLVGRCINEKETIYMTDFPEDYLNIASGLGQANPKCLLLVPVSFNQQVFGVIEMASFREFEQYQIDFVQRIGESIGSTISNVKMNEQTAKLLEESRIQSEELVAQEEEMRQNLEEMKTTQEELERKATDYEGIINALNNVALVAEFDMQGRLIEINRDFLRLFNKNKEEMLGTFQGAFAVTTEDRRNIFRDFWNDLRRGMVKKTIQHLRVNEKDIWLSEAYTPILDRFGKPYKVLNISIDITDSMKDKS